MSKILLTGMTAGHTSPNANKRTATFTQQLFDTLTQAGHTVTWAQPTHQWDSAYLDTYDAVLVGVAPVLSVASNHAYGALSVIEHLFYDPRLVLFLDAPVPAQITASLVSITNNPDRLIKAFFHRRPDWQWAQELGLARIYTAVELLLHGEWPKTIYPDLPWSDSRPDWLKWMPFGLIDSAVGINLDGVNLSDPLQNRPPEQLDYWLSETVKSPWLDKLMPSLTYGVNPMKLTRGATDKIVSSNLSAMTGAIIPPQKDGVVWWTPRIMQALHVGTPVVTEWRESQLISPHWGVLGGTIEDMDAQARYELAMKQRSAYLSSNYDHISATKNLERVLNI
jgi:hypothetical protein